METFDIIALIIRLIVSVVCGFISLHIATKKNIGGGIWFVWGFLFELLWGLIFGALPIIMLSIYPRNYTDEERVKLVAKAENQVYKEEIKKTGWRCSCGNLNPTYTGTCSCGKRKEE